MCLCVYVCVHVCICVEAYAGFQYIPPPPPQKKKQLAHPRVLEEIDSGFQTQKPWFAWGRIRGYYEVRGVGGKSVWFGRWMDGRMLL